jgi:uncharacterized membrane protein YhaH (DUF805 family)
MEISQTANRSPDGFIALATAPFTRYFDFSGRSRRKEYFYFLIFVLVASFAVGIYAGFTKTDVKILTAIIELGVFVPSLAVGVRRMHDTDHRGWWLLVPLVNLYFVFSKGQVGPNRFGNDPKQ